MGVNHTQWAVLALWLLSLAAAHGGSTPAKRAPEPELKRVVMYTYALATGGVSVDLRTGNMECFARGSRISYDEQQELKKKAQPGYPIFRIVAHLTGKELSELKSLLSRYSLRGFVPKGSDIRKRDPALDECPPSLVLTWSDKTEKLSLPLRGTVRSDLRADRKRAYEGMDKVCKYLCDLEGRYDKVPYLSVVPVKGPEYKRFEAERDKQ